MLYYTILYYAMLYDAMLYYAMLCYTRLEMESTSSRELLYDIPHISQGGAVIRA